MKTQCERILAYMRAHGSITQLDGFLMFPAITCVSQRVSDLRQTYNIKTRYEVNCSGGRYAVWSLGRKKCASR